MAPQETDFLRERPWFAKPLGQWGHLSPRHMLYNLGVSSSFIAVGMVNTLIEITLGLKGGGCCSLQFQVTARQSREVKVGGTRDSWPHHVQSREERHE